MKQDEFEPDTIFKLLKQSTTVTKLQLNRAGYADFVWDTVDGHEQAERKQVGEIMGNIGGIEDQIRGQLERHPEIGYWLIVEGVMIPTRSGCAQMKKVAWRKGQDHLIQAFEYRQPYERFEGFLTGLVRAGVRVKHTLDESSTARVLVQLEKSAQRSSTTLQRYTSPHITFHPDPQVQILIGMFSRTKVSLSVVRAEALIKEFGTVWEIMSTIPATLARTPGIGDKLAGDIHKTIGKIKE